MYDPDDEALTQVRSSHSWSSTTNTPAMSKHGTRTWSRRSAAAAEPQADGSDTRSAPSPATRTTCSRDQQVTV